MSFEITFLGTSGGPSERGNCALLVKSASHSYAQIIEGRSKPLLMIDAGSGWHALAELICRSRQKVRGSEKRSELSGLSPLSIYEDALNPLEYLGVEASSPFSSLEGPPLQKSKQIFSKVGGLLLSHPHLDHIQAMVLNSAGATEPGDKLVVHASDFTASALNEYIFNGVIWPDLVSLGFLDLVTIPKSNVFIVADGAYTVTFFEVSHGIVANKGRRVGCYKSSAFLITDNTCSDKILVFGDFEADSIHMGEKNAIVWRNVAPFVLDGSLKCLVLESSTPSKEPGANLYGHMTPTHIIAELQNLETACAKLHNDPSCHAPFVKGLKVFITHVKETCDGKDPRRKVLAELHQLNESAGLGLNFSIATNGISVVV